MTKLTPIKVKFLLDHKDNLLHRRSLIDYMTQVAHRTAFHTYPSEHPTDITTYQVDTLPDDAEYVPFKAEDTEELNPVQQWKLETGIELIHAPGDVCELIRQRRNWMCMSDQDKELSDTKCKEFFMVDNTTHYLKLLKKIETKGLIVQLYHKGVQTNLKCGLDVEITDDDSTIFKLYPLDTANGRLYSETDHFDMKAKDLVCCRTDTTTTVGRLILNYALVELFNGKVEYINNPGFGLSKLNKWIASGLLSGEVTTEQYKTFTDRLFFIGHFSELCVQTFTRAALTTDPNMAKKKELLTTQYADKLHDPIAIAELEKELVDMDRAHLKDDDAMRFYGALDDKAFHTQRKKMFIALGGVSDFSKEVSYNFIDKPLTEGWGGKELPALANDIRRGSYNRGHETQLGGAQTKYIIRVFQDLTISEVDCGTTRGVVIDFSKIPIKEFLGRYIIHNGKQIMLTEDNMPQYAKSKVLVRSPMYCRAKKGICAKCVGDLYAKLNMRHVAMSIVDISATFTKLSLKAMHGEVIETSKIHTLDEFIM